LWKKYKCNPGTEARKIIILLIVYIQLGELWELWEYIYIHISLLLLFFFLLVLRFEFRASCLWAGTLSLDPCLHSFCSDYLGDRVPLLFRLACIVTLLFYASSHSWDNRYLPLCPAIGWDGWVSWTFCLGCGLKLRFSSSQSPKYLGLQAWATGEKLFLDFSWSFTIYSCILSGNFLVKFGFPKYLHLLNLILLLKGVLIKDRKNLFRFMDLIKYSCPFMNHMD
jgi:hypothetical protein